MAERVLVTGGAGFIGSHIVDALITAGYEVRIFDNLDTQVHPTGRAPDYLNPEAEFINGDVRDKEALRRSLAGVDIVSHHAGAVGVGQSQYQINHYVDVNAVGTANLLESLVHDRGQIRKILVAASMSSYGEGSYLCESDGVVRPDLRGDKQMARGDWNVYCPACGRPVEPVPTAEEAGQNCNSIYALTKKCQEDMVQIIGRTYEIPAVALRYFNVFGPRQSLSNPYTGVAAIFMSRLKNGKSPVIYEDGRQTRDFIAVKDVVGANLAAIESPAADYRTFNVGSGRPRTIDGIARNLATLEQVDIDPAITRKFRKGDVRHCFADISEITKRLGWRPTVRFEDGMSELGEWSRAVVSVDGFDRVNKELCERGLV